MMLSLATLTAITLAACGGGAAGDSASPAALPEASQSADGAPARGDGAGATRPETGASAAVPAAPTPVPTPLVTHAQAFYFSASPTLAQAGALDAFGGTLVAGWNVDDTARMMRPGMKVVFYGRPSACADAARNGPVAYGDTADLLAALAQVGLADLGPADVPAAWTPTANAPACATLDGTSGGSAYVALAPFAADGGLALYTPAGPAATGSARFFRPFDAGGQNGRGANAFIAGTFVSFRQDWAAGTGKTPWGARADGSANDARLRSTQSVHAAQVGTAPGGSGVVQVKQQMMATFINTACARAGITAAHPCQIQYVLNTGIVRAGVSDWSGVTWYQAGSVSFDPVQGGMPIVEGPIGIAGSDTADGASGLPLFSSQGTATQHAAFGRRVFDVRIPFVDLQNALRVVVASKRGLAPSALVATDIAAMWGPQYADPAAWSLLSTDVAQETYDPLDSHAAAIGGVVADLFVGPQY